MADFYFDGEGDIRISPSGDIAVTDTIWRDDAQQAYIRAMTEPGDYLLYPNLGAHMSALFGMPQSPATGAFGEAILIEALNREGRFLGKNVSVKGVPIGPQTIRFDISIRSGDVNTLILSVQHNLGYDLETFIAEDTFELSVGTTEPPVIATIDPESPIGPGPSGTFTITGTGFLTVTSVTVEGDEMDFTIVSDTEITWEDTSETDGILTVEVTNPYGSDTITFQRSTPM